MAANAKVYIDGANIFYTQKKLGWTIDWQKVKNCLELEKTILEWRYYTGLKDDDEKMRSYIRYLDIIGFITITKPLKKIRLGRGENHPLVLNSNFIYKANFDTEITTDILLDKIKLEEIILFSGDSDFTYLTKKLKDIGKKVIVYSSRKTISWEIKLAASQIVYFEDIIDIIKR